MLPCNLVVQELAKNVIEVSAVDPVASMIAIENPKLNKLAGEIKTKLERVIESLHTGVESFGLVQNCIAFSSLILSRPMIYNHRSTSFLAMLNLY